MTRCSSTSPAGDPLGRNSFRGPWNRGLSGRRHLGVHLHDLRGSAATWAAQAEATIAGLTMRLRHRTPPAAMRYQHTTAERNQAIAEKLGAVLHAAAADTPLVREIR